MAILVDKDSKVIVQGITGKQGSFHTKIMMDYGTNVVGGTTPGRGGEWFEGKPVFDTVQAAVDTTNATVSMIIVPAPFAPDAIYEAVDAGIKLHYLLNRTYPGDGNDESRASCQS